MPKTELLASFKDKQGDAEWLVKMLNSTGDYAKKLSKQNKFSQYNNLRLQLIQKPSWSQKMLERLSS